VLSPLCFLPKDLINVFPLDSNTFYSVSSLKPVRRIYGLSPIDSITDVILDTADYTTGACCINYDESTRGVFYEAQLYALFTNYC
jgi:hypothetical protein